MALVHKLKTAEWIIQIRIKIGRISGSKLHASMAHEKFEKTFDFMNSANGVLIVAGHDYFLHTVPATSYTSSWSTHPVMPVDDCRFRALTIKPPSDFLILKTKNGRKLPTSAAITAYGTNFICST